MAAARMYSTYHRTVWLTFHMSHFSVCTSQGNKIRKYPRKMASQSRNQAHIISKYALPNNEQNNMNGKGKRHSGKGKVQYDSHLAGSPGSGKPGKPEFALHGNGAPRAGKIGKDKHGTLRAGKIGKHKHASCACYQAGSPRSQQEEEEDEDASQQAGKLAFPTKGRSSFFKHASTASYQGKPEYASHDEQEEEVDASTALHQGKPEYASHDNGAERAGKLGKGNHGTLRAEKIGKDKHASLALCQDGSTRLQQEEKDEYALQQAGSQACQKKTSLPCSRLAPKHLPQPIQL
jgi:hypothetical protein